MDFLLKQRLVGAVVLVALGVILIPMLLEGPDRTPVPEMEALPVPVGQALSKPLEAFPAPEEIPLMPDPAVVLADPQSEKPPVSEAPAATAQPAAGPEPITPPPEPRESPVKPGPLAGWVVQVGSFSNQQNAVRLRDKLRAAGFATQVEKVRVDGKSHFRVRIGPFLEQAEAEKSRQQVLENLSLKGRVLSYP